MAHLSFKKRASNVFLMQRASFLAPIYKISKKRLVEIDILRATAILLILLARIPQSIVSYNSSFSQTSTLLAQLASFIGLSIFFFVSGYSLYLNNKTIGNLKAAINFYKKRFLRIYPLYWAFVTGYVIFYKPSFEQALIFFTGFEAFFYPILIRNTIFHFLSAIIVFYLLFPLIVHFNDYSKMLVISAIPLLAFAVLLQFNVSDPILLDYYSVFVGGIIAAKANAINIMREKSPNLQRFALTMILFVAPLSLLMWGRNYFNSATLLAFLNGFYSIPVVLVMSYWAVVYVRNFNTKFSPVFTFAAISTLGAYFIYDPFFKILGNTLYLRFNVTGAAASGVLVASIPLIIVIGYVLQFAADVLVNSALLHFHRFRAKSGK